MRLRYTRPALEDLDAILTYIAERSPLGEQRVKARIRSVIELLLASPHIGLQTTDPTIRRVNASPYPYIVFYEATAQEVIIHAVRHSARDPSQMPGVT